MRSDYALYTVAIILFIITGISFALPKGFERDVSVVTTAVLGLFFVGLGYAQRPKPKVAAIEVTPPSPAPAPPPVTEVVKEEKTEALAEVAPPVLELTEVKGIGEKRAEQLKALGISRVEELAKASAEDLAEKLKISPRITNKWIESAKKLVEAN